MTTGQRKQAKKIADLHPELSCVSYGFGQERQLHLFKKAKGNEVAFSNMGREFACAKDQVLDTGMPGVSVKNTFIDDWIAADISKEETEPGATRSMPPRLPRLMESCTVGSPDKLDLSPIKESAIEEASPDVSTAASSAGSSVGSPRSLHRDLLSLAMGFRPPPGLEVRNTFVHFDSVPSPSAHRAVQSMPRDMFRSCLLEEVLSNLNERAKLSTGLLHAEVPEASSRPVPLDLQSALPLATPALATQHVLAPGTKVVIDGLVKAPAFNGLSGIVQSLDEETGRHNILLSYPAGGHKTAKVKAENLVIVEPTPSPCFAADLSLEECKSPAWCMRSKQPLLLRALV
jgi:hypothetical protein